MTSKSIKNPPYTQVPNHALEWLLGPNALSKREIKVMLLVFRYTYGFHRDSATLSNRYVHEATGIDPSTVSKTFSSLSKKGVLRVEIANKTRKATLIPSSYRTKNEYEAEEDFSFDGSEAWDEPEGRVKTTLKVGSKRPLRKKETNKEEVGINVGAEWLLSAVDQANDSSSWVDNHLSEAPEPSDPSLEELLEWSSELDDDARTLAGCLSAVNMEDHYDLPADNSGHLDDDFCHQTVSGFFEKVLDLRSKAVSRYESLNQS